MAIKEIIDLALRTSWTDTSDFEVIITNKKAKSIYTDSQLKGIIPKSLISIDLPSLNSQESDTVQGGERRIGVKMFEAFRINAKFRDFGAGALRTYFEAIWMAQQFEYFDDIKTSIKIQAPRGDGFDNILFYTDDALITSVSSIQFDNNNAQIAEFDVTFICSKFSNELAKNFGESKFIENFKIEKLRLS